MTGRSCGGALRTLRGTPSANKDGVDASGCEAVGDGMGDDLQSRENVGMEERFDSSEENGSSGRGGVRCGSSFGTGGDGEGDSGDQASEGGT